MKGYTSGTPMTLEACETAALVTQVTLTVPFVAWNVYFLIVLNALILEFKAGGGAAIASSG